jgi:hypothetical protein
MRNQLQTFFVDADEDALARRLRSTNPRLFFVDHHEAAAPDARVRTELLSCRSGFAYIWNAATEDVELASESWRTRVAQKSGDAFVQFLRSRWATEELVDGTIAHLLLSGRVAACYAGNGTEEQKNLKKLVYAAVNRISSADVLQVAPTTRKALGGKHPGFRVGKHAIDWSRTPPNILRHADTKTFYCLPAAVVQDAK